MTNQALSTVMQQTLEASVRDEPQVNSLGVLGWLIETGGTIPPWWSIRRDAELRRITLKSDHLMGAVYAMISKIVTIPFEVIPRDKTISRHSAQAEERTHCLLEDSEYLKGWNVLLTKFLLDHYTQDNGGFMQIVGGGAPDGPIIGWPFGLVHMDAARMQRTNSPEYPCIYTDAHGQRYKVHYTRVIEMSSLPSANILMNGVGYCAISRCINVAQNLIDIATYEQEKLGSRPARTMLVGEYISTADIRKAFELAGDSADQARLTRFARTVAVGNPTAATKINRIDLASVPDGFNKDESTELGICAIALAFGVDMREFWPATTTGATKSDAEMQHQKAKGKWGEILQRLQRVINQKFLPPQLEFRFDYHTEEDNQVHAQVEYNLAQSAEMNLGDGALTTRIVREKWLDSGNLTDAQFEYLELQDGRLADGTDVLALFTSADPDIQALLKLPLANPTRIADNDPAQALTAIDAQLETVVGININTVRDVVKQETRQAVAALTKLRSQYDEVGKQQKQIQAQQTQGVQNAAANSQVQSSDAQPGPPEGGPKGSPKPDGPASRPGPQGTGSNVESPV